MYLLKATIYTIDLMFPVLNHHQTLDRYIFYSKKLTFRYFEAWKASSRPAGVRRLHHWAEKAQVPFLSLHLNLEVTFLPQPLKLAFPITERWWALRCYLSRVIDLCYAAKHQKSHSSKFRWDSAVRLNDWNVTSPSVQ